MSNLTFGLKAMNDYTNDPEPFEDIKFVAPGFQWVDPAKEIKAFQDGVRDGFTSRTLVCSQQGVDAADIDVQQVADNKRADSMGLAYDSDGRRVLTGKNAGLQESEIEEAVAQGKAEV